jgi:CHASE3 domain sensor protein/anti-anti-sigma regulatory factor
MRVILQNLGIRSKIMVGAILALVIVVSMASWVYHGIVVSQARDDDLAQTTEITSAIDAMHLQLVNMELGYRGFLIVGDDTLLTPYTTGYQSYTRTSAHVRELLQPDPQQLDRLNRLDRAVGSWHDSVLETGIALRRILTGAPNAAYTAFITDDETSKHAFLDLTNRVAAFRAIETDRDIQRSQEAQAAAANLKDTLVIGTVLAVLASLGVLWLLATNIARRVGHITQIALHMADGMRTVRATLPPALDEVGQLARAFNTMAAMIEQYVTDLQNQAARADAARCLAETAQAQSHEQLALIDAQHTVIREMSVPLLPLSATTLVMPLVGALDSTRIGLIHTQALHALEQTQAKDLLLDITGVPVVDTQVAQGLLQLVEMGKLMGTRVSIVGIRPEVAQAIVGLGLDLATIRTYSTLQDGIGNLLVTKDLVRPGAWYGAHKRSR